MKVTELQKKSKSELKKLIADKGEHLRTLRFSLAVGKLKNVREIRETKRDIARILTIMKHKE